MNDEEAEAQYAEAMNVSVSKDAKDSEQQLAEANAGRRTRI